GFTHQGLRSYFGSQMPVAEAFILWARTTAYATPDRGASVDPSKTPRPLWWIWGVIFALPAVAFLATIPVRRRTRRSQNKDDEGMI
ncbi:MAG: hypothetical protein FWD55_03740, partial [Propionibacteriaceae bacterium]|nr:hypothetical protein [Propionibacteriaceae bacterium]